MPSHCQASYPMDDEMDMNERLKNHKATGGVYMRRRIKTNGGIKPMCPQCYKSLMTVVKPLEPRPSRLS
jgi:hypothetical protein